MKKTWIIILVLTMMMMVVCATGCGEKESPPADTPEPEPVVGEPADDGDDEMQKGGSSSNPLEGFDFDSVNLEGAAKVAEEDDANFRGSAGMDGWKRASDLP